MPTARAIELVQRLTCIGDDSPGSLYAERVRRNIEGIGRRRTVRYAWEGLVIGVLTTQQRSTGKYNPVRDLLNSKTLTWDIVRNDRTSITNMVNGFNHNKKKRNYLRSAREWLLKNADELREYLVAIENIPVDNVEDRYTAEVDAANFLSYRSKDVKPKGIGLKQSRNILQYLGYSVWTIPLDSRIRGILEAPPFSIKPKLEYLEIEEKVIDLCLGARTYPCLLDASLFDLEGLIRSYVGLPRY